MFEFTMFVGPCLAGLAGLIGLISLSVYALVVFTYTTMKYKLDLILQYLQYLYLTISHYTFTQSQIEFQIKPSKFDESYFCVVLLDA